MQFVFNRVYQARGGFQLSTMGTSIGSNLALSDLTQGQNLFFHVLGETTFPLYPQIIVTVDDIEAASFTV